MDDSKSSDPYLYDPSPDEVIRERATAATGLLSHLLNGDRDDAHEILRGIRTHLAVIELEHQMGRPF